ncbi:MAG: glycosyltransferase family 2 protein [Patescibacteria group bacterium]|jgi:GT2 family glycosyltransferase
MKISINIVTYNAIHYIDECLRSVLNQTFQDFKIIVVDNASADGTLEHIKKNYPNITVLQNFKNLGFAKANNQAIKFWDSEYVLLVNQDVILQPEFLERIVKTADTHPRYGSFGGKVIKINNESNNSETSGSKIIDTTGITASKARRFVDRGAGEQDTNKYNKQEMVFGISGSLVLYRRSALEEVKLRNNRARESYKFAVSFEYFEYFDEDFFMYKEDVDLAWRLQLAAWPALYVPTAESSHHRSGFGHAKANNLTTIRDRRRKSKIVNQYSFRNHWLMILKNDYFSNWILHLPWILFYEVKKFLYILFLETFTLRTIGQVFILLPSALAKRRQIKKIRKITARDIRPWFR